MSCGRRGVLDNLRSVCLPGGTTTIEYLIDRQNRRVGEKLNGKLVQGLLYGGQLNPETGLDGSNQLVSRFVYGSKGHVPDCLVKAGVTNRLIIDHLDSVRVVVNGATGEIVQRLDCDAFGQVTRNIARYEFRPMCMSSPVSRRNEKWGAGSTLQ